MVSETRFKPETYECEIGMALSVAAVLIWEFEIVVNGNHVLVTWYCKHRIGAKNVMSVSKP